MGESKRRRWRDNGLPGLKLLTQRIEKALRTRRQPLSKILLALFEHGLPKGFAGVIALRTRSEIIG